MSASRPKVGLYGLKVSIIKLNLDDIVQRT